MSYFAFKFIEIDTKMRHKLLSLLDGIREYNIYLMKVTIKIQSVNTIYIYIKYLHDTKINTYVYI